MAKPSELLMDGAAFDPEKPTPTILKIKNFLDAAPRNEVFSVVKLKDMAKVGVCAVRVFTNERRYAHYTHRYGNHRDVWVGHPEAIELLKKKVAEYAK